ncbi:VOC family protein [Microbacterium sp. 1P10UB]|uniref:VOC family protein n=1 Tax=unclassified Microbacterium TaxID=2609290 RepID=UPI00399F30F4
MADQPRIYPEGVPCWVDIEVADREAAERFYSAVFGWEFLPAMPPEAPGFYDIAALKEQDAAAIGGGTGEPVWNTYIACDDVDSTAAAVTEAGGTVLSPPADAGPGGRLAVCADPQGAVFRLWQARRRLGAQIVNEPGAWNFSYLRTPEPDAALAFYGAVFGWRVDPDLGAGMIRLPGYGEHLASTVDPGIHERQAFAPPGFADVVAGIAPTDGPACWEVRFTSADRDESVEAVRRAGGQVLSSAETDWTREAVVADPPGATFVVSQLAPRE